MSVLKVTALVDVDDAPIAPQAFVRRVTYTNFEAISSQRASSVSFVALPTGEITVVQALILTTDQPIAIGFNNQSAQTITLNANGILVIEDANLGIPLVQNNSGNPANLRGIIAGT